MNPTRIYMNSFNEALDFANKIRPVCSLVKVPDALDWIYFDKPFIITINYNEPTLCIEIYLNKHEDQNKQ